MTFRYQWALHEDAMAGLQARLTPSDVCRHKEYRDWEQETIVWASRELNLNPLKGRLLATLYMMNPALEQLVVLRETTNLPGGSSEA